VVVTTTLRIDLVKVTHQLCDSSVRINGDQSSVVMMMVVIMVVITTDVLTIDALNSLRRLFFAKLFYPHVESTEELVCSRLLANP
jgi:hypothetical protein